MPDLFKIVTIFNVFFICYVAARKLPSYVHVCNRDDPNLPKCFIEKVNELRPYLIKGIPEMQIPPIEPLFLPKISINQKGGASIGLECDFTDVEIYGCKDFQITEPSVDFKNLKFGMKILFPRLRIKSNYAAKGKLLVVPLNGSGKSDVNFTDVSADGQWIGKVINKNDKEYINFEESSIKLKTGPGNIYLGNLFPNNQELTDNTNRILNENIDAIKEELAPIIEEAISSIVTDIVNRVYNLYSIDQLFPKK